MNLSHRVPIIKAVGDACNLRCTYCFYNGTDQRPHSIMDRDLLEEFLRQYFSLFSGELRFVWHGGEPLLAGISFYEDVISLQRRFSKEGDVVENMIQTNATCITDQWAEFFKRNTFHIGVSIDGNRDKHDKQRLDSGGRGSFDRVLSGIETLRRHGITPGVIQTLLRSGVESLSDDIRFFVEELKIQGWALNLFMDGSSRGELTGEGLRDEDVAKIYSILFSEWLERNDPNICLREIENVVAGALGRRAKSCSFNGTCANYFCLDAEGRVWPCDRMSSDPKFMLGDFRKQTLLEILEVVPAVTHAVCARQLAKDCVSCRWRNACNNGCTAMRDAENGKYVYCVSRQKAFQAVETLLYSTNPDGCVPDLSAERR